MHRHLQASPLLLLLLAAGCSASQQRSPAPTAASGLSCRSATFDAGELERRAAPATLLIATSGGTGSGFAIRAGKEQLVVTNYHVVASGDRPTAITMAPGGGARHTALQVVSVARDHDLALLRPAAELGTPVLELSEQKPRVGDGVAALGYPGVAGSLPTLTLEPGTVTAAQRTFAGTDFIQTNANINFGNSGGPLVDACGKVVGVVSAKHLQTERVGLAVPAEQLRLLAVHSQLARPSPEQAVEQQLQGFLTEVRFRRSDKASRYLGRGFVQQTAKELEETRERARKVIAAALSDLQKRGVDTKKMPSEELEKKLTNKLDPAEKRVLGFMHAAEQQKLDAMAAAALYLTQTSADLLGELDDAWLESTSPTKEGCMDAYVTASTGGELHRFVLHLHDEWGDWLIVSAKRVR